MFTLLYYGTFVIPSLLRYKILEIKFFLSIVMVDTLKKI